MTHRAAMAAVLPRADGWREEAALDFKTARGGSTERFISASGNKMLCLYWPADSRFRGNVTENALA